MQTLIGVDGISQRLKKYTGGSWVDFSPAPSASALVDTRALWTNGEDIILYQGFWLDTAMKHYHNGAWTNFSLPGGTAPIEIQGYVGTSYNSVYAFGRRSSSHAYVMHWNGSAWSTLFEIANGRRFESASMSSETNIWFIHNDASPFGIYQWNGSMLSANHWTAIYAMDNYLNNDIAVHTESSTETYVFAYRDEPFVTDRCEIYLHNGATWSYVRPVNPAVGLNPQVKAVANDLSGNVILAMTASNAQRMVKFTPAADTVEWSGGDYRYQIDDPSSVVDDIYVSMYTSSGNPTWGDIRTRDSGGTWSQVASSTGFQWLAVEVFGFVLYAVSVDIEEGTQGANTIFDGYFISPYTQSSVHYSNSDGYDGYDFIIIKDNDLGLGNITVDVTVDGYEDPININPAPGSYDVARDTEIRFRVRK